MIPRHLGPLVHFADVGSWQTLHSISTDHFIMPTVKLSTVRDTACLDTSQPEVWSMTAFCELFKTMPSSYLHLAQYAQATLSTSISKFCYIISNSQYPHHHLSSPLYCSSTVQHNATWY